jgi:MoaA/NifB/PqqE/SkfB family radical SAM enzyme
VREATLASLYRESELFLRLRNPSLFQGNCGACEYNRICGGSRSRAYALTGDYLATDPWCAYQPEGSGPQRL